jgi:hypothetical protein
MGSPRYPTRGQVEQLNRVADENSAEELQLTNGMIDLEVPVNGIIVLEAK